MIIKITLCFFMKRLGGALFSEDVIMKNLLDCIDLTRIRLAAMKTKNVLFYLIILTVFVLQSSTVVAEVSGPIFLTTDLGTTEVLAWSWGAAGGGGVSAASISDIAITRLSDSQSAGFLGMVAEGKHLSEVTLTRGSMILTLTSVLVSSYSANGTSVKKEPMTETITLNFLRFEYEIDSVTYCFDIEANTPCE